MNSSISHFLYAILLGLAKVAQISLRHISHTWVYLVLGIVAGSLISIYVPKKSLARAFNHSGVPSILLAEVLGVLSPLGSYAVIPIFGTMLASGFPLGSRYGLSDRLSVDEPLCAHYHLGDLRSPNGPGAFGHGPDPGRDLRADHQVLEREGQIE